MLENKRSRLFISFVLAFVLWFYVVGQKNPTTHKTYREIPVTLTNEQTLSDNGLAVLGRSDETMRVTVSGKRSAINKLSKSDIVATVDLSNAAEGTNKLPVDLKIPENIDIDNQSLNEITVSTEERITRAIKVKVIYSGTYPEGKEPAAVKIDPESVKVSGAKSFAERVSYVKAEIDADELPEELSSSMSLLYAMESDGRSVSNVTLSSAQCKITSIMYDTKRVPLKVSVKDKSDDGNDRSIVCQQTMLIKGDKDDLSGVKQIKTQKADITNVGDNEKITVVPKLPEGIYAANADKKITLTVRVKEKN